MRTCLLFLSTLIAALQSFSQNTIGIPGIINYSKEAYNGGTQNWDIVQGKNNIMYFANNEGLLSFDGSYWKIYPLPNKTMVRSLAIGKDNKIYAGGQDELGYFSPAVNGKLSFTSLKPLLSPADAHFTDIWDIITFGNEIFFRSKNKIFRYKNKTLTVYNPANEWKFLGVGCNQVIAQDSRKGLFHFNNGLWEPLSKGSELPEHFLVTAMIPFGKDSSLIITIKDGIYILANNNITPFKINGHNPFLNKLILSASVVNNNWFAVGTNIGGCFIISRNGDIIQNLSREDGMQDNNIVSMFLDRSQNLWLGLDKGIDFIAYNNAIKHIYPEKLNEGVGYTSIVSKNELYIGTSNGLYKVPVSENADLSFINSTFTAVPNIKGSAWNLSEVDGNLLLGHHEGAFLIKNGNALPISTGTGYWNFLSFNNMSSSPQVIAGNYNGLDIFDYRNKQFISKGNLPDFNSEGRFIIIDKNIMWVAHPYRGVYKITMEANDTYKAKLYDNKKGLPSLNKNQLYKVKNRIVVATEKGIYEYNPKNDVFEASGYFKQFFGQRNIHFLREDATGNIWFIEDKIPGVVDFSQTKPQIIYFPELNAKVVTGFEHIYPYNSKNIFVGAEKGFYHINFEAYKKNRNELKVVIAQAKALGKNDSLLFGGYFGNVNETLTQSKNTIPNISSNSNSLHFEYSSPSYGIQSNIEYSYMLKGFDQNWSDWSKKTEKDYTNLPPGTFTFQIKAKSNLGNESNIDYYTFTVLPPWYKTTTAYIIYSLLFLLFIYLLYRGQKIILQKQKNKYEQEQRRLQYLHQLELEKSEKEIIALKNEKLQAEIEGKNSELASVAMHLVQKGELLLKIKEELIRIRKMDTEMTSDEFKKLIRILKEEDKIDEEWDQFAAHFDNIHHDFIKALKENFPALTPHELKLCAYLIMNLSTKEIAQLMNITVRGVEVSRYRLRKKLQISTETNLFDFLLEFSASKIE